MRPTNDNTQSASAKTDLALITSREMIKPIVPYFQMITDDGVYMKECPKPLTEEVIKEYLRCGVAIVSYLS